MTPIIARVCSTAVIGLAAFVWMQPVPAAASDPTGTWLTEDGRARIRTEHCGSKGEELCGYVVWLQKPLDEAGKPRVDKFNPDPRRQSRPVLGHQMLLGLKPNEEGRHVGKIYSGDNGKSYDVTVWSEQPSELSVKGCMLPVFCGSQTWTRVTDVASGQLRDATDAAGGPTADPEWALKAGASPNAAGVHKGRPTGATPPAAR